MLIQTNNEKNAGLEFCAVHPFGPAGDFLAVEFEIERDGMDDSIIGHIGETSLGQFDGSVGVVVGDLRVGARDDHLAIADSRFESNSAEAQEDFFNPSLRLAFGFSQGGANRLAGFVLIDNVTAAEAAGFSFNQRQNFGVSSALNDFTDCNSDRRGADVESGNDGSAHSD